VISFTSAPLAVPAVLLVVMLPPSKTDDLFDQIFAAGIVGRR
jgi:hypothetical protein